MTTSPKPLLIVGATGKQGKGLINTLIASPVHKDYTILAVTRNSASASAKALAAKSSSIKLVQGNVDDCPALFAAALEATNNTPIYGVFLVLVSVTDGWTPEREVRQGKGMIDEAIKHNVSHFVYTSSDRVGDKSLGTPTYVPHFKTKDEIERYLVDKSSNGKMLYTILRPCAFFENLTYDFFGRSFATWWKISIRPSKPMALIACSDIGFFALQGFLHPEDPTYRNGALSLAGDDLTFDQGNQVFRDKAGFDMPLTYEFIARFIIWWLPELSTMFRYFDEVGFETNIPKLKKLHPGLMRLDEWMEKESGFPTKSKRA